jgi:lipopolysaccharide transport system permease protein
MIAFLTAPFRSALEHRQLLKALVVREVHTTYRSSLLGASWLVLQPLLSLAVYAAVFGGILGSGSMEFVSDLFAGMIVYGAFAETTGRAAQLVLARPNYVTKVAFPLEVLPWPVAAQSALNALISTAILLLLHGVFVAVPSWTAVLLPLILVPPLLLGLAFGWALAAVGVYVRDTDQVVRVLLQLLFFLCPIVWSLEAIQNPTLQTIVACNPLAIMIEGMRSALSGTAATLPAAWPAAVPFALVVAFAVVAAAAAYGLFQRLRGGFADVL